MAVQQKQQVPTTWRLITGRHRAKQRQRLREKQLWEELSTLQPLFTKWLTSPLAFEGGHSRAAIIRYALKRPLMPQAELDQRLIDFGHLMFPAKLQLPRGRTWKILQGIDSPEFVPSYRLQAQYQKAIKNWSASRDLYNREAAPSPDGHQSLEDPYQPSGSALRVNLSSKHQMETIRANFLSLYSDRIRRGLEPGAALTEYCLVFDIEEFSPAEKSSILAGLKDIGESSRDETTVGGDHQSSTALEPT